MEHLDRLVVDPFHERGHVETLDHLLGAGGAVGATNKRLDEPGESAVEREIAAAHLEVCQLRFHADPAGAGHGPQIPIGIEGPVGAQLDEQRAGAHVGQQAVKERLFLWLVVAVETGDDP